MSNPQQDKQPRKLQVLKPSPRQQRRNWQRENQEKKSARKQWTDNQPPNDAA